jgi:hypothetical protein
MKFSRLLHNSNWNLHPPIQVLELYVSISHYPNAKPFGFLFTLLKLTKRNYVLHAFFLEGYDIF